MLTLLFLVIFSALAATFATQNTNLVALQFGNFLLPEIPLYLVVLGSIAIGVFLSLLLHLINAVSWHTTVFGKNREIRQREKETAHLSEKVQNLEHENNQLREEQRVFVRSPKIGATG